MLNVQRKTDSMLPNWRWRALCFGTICMLGVYYVNYMGEFVEGTVQGVSGIALLLRLASVAIMFGALVPLVLRPSIAWVYVFFYMACLGSMTVAAGVRGSFDDAMLLNTIVQLPLLLAFAHSKWKLDMSRWFRFVGITLVCQGVIDALVWQLGEALWLSGAFVGGFGNPSSFGLACVVLMAFFLLHPRAGRNRLLLAVALALSALMTKSLFAFLGLTFVYLVWAAQTRLRLASGLVLSSVLLAGAMSVLDVDGAGEGDTPFLLHKLNAAAAIVGVAEYDTDSSASVSLRGEMHERTFAALDRSPSGWFIGHLEGMAYWHMDSQFLTYLGSFGAPITVFFFAMHVAVMLSAFRARRFDGGFTFLALALLAGNFFTNRILDYFPIAALYFACIVMAGPRQRGSVAGPAHMILLTRTRIRS